ncbi:MAG: Ig-like domain-containing protein, partial [Gemmatimonadota bacterium]|nr:Ig-like domain-containing protein [Gemmatimonadota bacterium]
MRHQLLARSLAIAAIGFASCHSSTEPGNVPRATSIEVTPNPLVLKVAASQQLGAAVKDQSGALLTGAAVTFTSGNTSVATVTTSGSVTAVSLGSATITATSGSVSTNVTVNTTADLVVTTTSFTLCGGATQQISALLKDATGAAVTGGPVSYASSNTSIAQVSSGGLITGGTTSGSA